MMKLLVGSLMVVLAIGGGNALGQSVKCDSEGRELQKAIDKAPPGSTIRLSGLCATGPYFVQKNLTLIGPATLAGAPSDGAVISVTGATVTFLNITINAAGAQYGIFSRGSTIAVQDVKVTDSGGSGIHVAHTSFANIENLNLIDNDVGVYITESSSAAISNARIEGSRTFGIHVIAASSAIISETEMVNGNHAGLAINIMSNASLFSSIIEGNQGPGVLVADIYSSVLLREEVNTLSGNNPDVQCFPRGYVRVDAPQLSSTKTSQIIPGCILVGSLFAP
jgi:nitrous oxidase accessory protein NosD